MVTSQIIAARKAVQRRQQRAASEESRLTENMARIQMVSGQFGLAGTGEAAKEVSFPVRFIEKPLFSFGGELDAASFPTEGSFPTVSVVVRDWNIIDADGRDSELPVRRYYVGATLLVVTTGVNENMWIHWHMMGRAIVNPVSDIGSLSTDSTI